MTAATLTSEWVTRARDMAPVVEKWRDAGEQERRLPAPLFEALKSTGFFRLMVPRAFGGEQVDVVTMVSVIEELSRLDGAVGWNVFITAGSGSFADYLPEETAQEMYGDGSVAVGSFAPTGQALEVDGGYRCSGRWNFGSGCQNANWITGGFLIMQEGSPRMLPNGAPDILVGIVPAGEVEILDTWHTAGLRGTGSQDYQVKDVFIPQRRTFPFFDFFAGPAERPSRAYHHGFFNAVSPAMAAVSLGIARDAIESFKAMATAKTPQAGRTTLAQQATAQLRVGMAEAKLRAARAYIYETAELVSRSRPTSQSEGEELAASVRLATAYAAQTATEAVDLVFDAAGGSSVYESSRLARCFRDVHMVTHHILMSPSNIEMVGQYLLGLGLEMRR